MMIRTRIALLVVFAFRFCSSCEARSILPSLISTVSKGVGVVEQGLQQHRRSSPFKSLIGRTEFEHEATLEPDTESPQSPNIEENENEDDERPHNGLQVLITHKMKRILVDELKYLPNEVEDMEPQIAKVLIDRRLIRPRKGIPDTWRRKSISDANHKRDWDRLRKHFNETLRDTVTWTKSNVLPFLPAIVIGTICWLQRDLLLGIAHGLWSRISIRRTPTDDEDDYRGNGNDWQQDTSSRSRSSKLDLKAYEKVRKPSFGDSVFLRTKAWRTNNDW